NSRPKKFESRPPETKSPRLAPFSSKEGNSLKLRLPGWRRSADRTRLRNFAANTEFYSEFCALGLPGLTSSQETAVLQAPLRQFPTSINREHNSDNREFLGGNREFGSQKTLMSPFGVGPSSDIARAFNQGGPDKIFVHIDSDARTFERAHRSCTINCERCGHGPVFL